MKDEQLVYDDASFAAQVRELIDKRIIDGVYTIDTVHLQILDFQYKSVAELYFRDVCRIGCGRIETCPRINDNIVAEYIKKTDAKIYRLLDLLPKEEVDALVPWSKRKLDVRYESKNILRSYIDLSRVRIFFDEALNKYVFDPDQEEFFTAIYKVINKLLYNLIF